MSLEQYLAAGSVVVECLGVKKLDTTVPLPLGTQADAKLRW